MIVQLHIPASILNSTEVGVWFCFSLKTQLEKLKSQLCTATFLQKIKGKFIGMKVLPWYVSLSIKRGTYVKYVCHTGLQECVCV